MLEYKPLGMHDPDYARFFTKARVVAWQYGFALLAHGSMNRDLDLLMVPWEERANDKMAFRCINQLALHSNMTLKSEEPKLMPHGRKAYTLLFPPDANGIHDPRWVDLSVMPCRKAPASATEEPRTDGGEVAPAPAGNPPEDSYPDQTILHAEGECGNCLQATIAGVLGWPLAAVPHFALLGEDHWWDCAQAWLSSQGYWIDYQPTSYADQGGELLPRCWLSGRSPRGFSHAVIGDSATLQMLHDPHPSRAGLEEHSYTIYFFRKPARGVPASSPASATEEPIAPGEQRG